MAMLKGKTQAGRVYSVLYQYFLQQPVGMRFKRGHVETHLLNLHRRMYPDITQNDSTAIMDGIACLTGHPDGPFQKLDNGYSRLTRRFEPILDDKRLQRNYYKFAKKGKRWKEMPEKKKEKYRRTKVVERSAIPSETEGLLQLGNQSIKHQYDAPTSDLLETFANQYPGRDYVVEYIFKEFSSLCPKTGAPDFAVVHVRYIPDKLCIETKSLKLYFLAFRQFGSFMESITNRILEDCVSVCLPRWMKITSNFNARGGTLINVEAEHNETD